LTASANEIGWVRKLLVTEAAETNEPGKPVAAQQKNQNTSIKLIRWRILVRCFGFCIRRAHKHKYASGASFAGPGQFRVQHFKPRLILLLIIQLAHASAATLPNALRFLPELY
jgi:hypothetical protein